VRIWHPIDPWLLDDARISGEHRELHCIWAVLTMGKAGYRNHPETRRWRGHLPALARRHAQLVVEMRRRGWKAGHVHASPVQGPPGPVVWPPLWEPLVRMIDCFNAKVSPGIER